MIRFKHNILPVWFQFDGDEETLSRAKQSIIEDIKLNGLNHYTGYADIHDEPSDEEKEWDGSPVEAPIETVKKTKSTKGADAGTQFAYEKNPHESIETPLAFIKSTFNSLTKWSTSLFENGVDVQSIPISSVKCFISFNSASEIEY